MIYVFSGDLTEGDMSKIRGYLIDPGTAREASWEKPATLAAASLPRRLPANRRVQCPGSRPVPGGAAQDFASASENDLQAHLGRYALNADIIGLRLIQERFRDRVKRDPTATELRVMDAYWSLSCSQPALDASLCSVEIDDPEVASAYENYLSARQRAYGGAAAHTPQTLRDIATIAARALRPSGDCGDKDISGELSAASIHVSANVDGKAERWLLAVGSSMCSHPVGSGQSAAASCAAACAGTAIRRTLSLGAYAYQAMRVTCGSAPRR